MTPGRRPFVAFIEPMAATQVAELPRGPEWSYEIKLDGYRVLAVKSGDDVRLLSRRNKDLTRDFPSVVAALRGVRATTATLDGEIVAVDENGVPRFQALQHRSRTRPERIVYYAFDLLQLDGRDFMAKPLDERRQRLAEVLQRSGVLLSQPLSGDVDDIIEAARRLKLEGLVAKRRDSRYEPGVRSMAWQKLRLNRSQEFVVGGYSPGNPFDALLVGYYSDAGAFLFAARVRAGFTPAVRRQVFRRLGPAISMCPFANLPMGRSGGWNEGVSAEDMTAMTWVAPEVVVQLAFVEWTDYGLLRHASYLGIREDKEAADVKREDG